MIVDPKVPFSVLCVFFYLLMTQISPQTNSDFTSSPMIHKHFPILNLPSFQCFWSFMVNIGFLIGLFYIFDKNLKGKANTKFRKLSDWLTANTLTLNIQKSNFILFHPHQKRATYPSKYMYLIVRKAAMQGLLWDLNSSRDCAS